MNNFENLVNKNLAMPIQEAIAALMKHHDVPEKNILDAFSNLKKHSKTDSCTVTFAPHPDTICLTMRICDAAGKQLDTELVDQYTGQPVNHVH